MDLRLVRLMGDYYYCPNTGRVILGLKGDDKALCGCGRVNPACPQEHPGVHVVRFLKPATPEAYIEQGRP